MLVVSSLLIGQLSNISCAHTHTHTHTSTCLQTFYIKFHFARVLQAIIRCMSVQFDMVVKDRQLILHKLSQLQSAMPRRNVLSWSFFLGRLQQLFVEAELNENTSESASARGRCGPKREVLWMWTKHYIIDCLYNNIFAFILTLWKSAHAFLQLHQHFTFLCFFWTTSIF